MRLKRAVKQGTMAHSSHIEDFFQKSKFKCTNGDDFLILARLLRSHLQNAQLLNSRKVQRRLLVQQLDMLNQQNEKHRRLLSELSFDKCLRFARINCAALSRALLLHYLDYFVDCTLLKKASSLCVDELSDFVQGYWQQLKQVEPNLHIVYQDVLYPLYTLATQETEDAFNETKQQLLTSPSNHTDIRNLSIDLNPSCAVSLLSFVQNLSLADLSHLPPYSSSKDDNETDYEGSLL